MIFTPSSLVIQDHNVSLFTSRKLRKQLTSNDFRRAARKPWRRLSVKVPQLGDTPRPSGGGEQQIVILD